MSRHQTAGKGLGIVLRAQNGAMRLSVSRELARGFLEIMESQGAHAMLSLRADDLKELAKALLKIASAIEAADPREEITQH